MIGGVVVDAAILIALATRSNPRAAAYADVAASNLRVIAVPAAALAEAWARLDERDQAFLALLTNTPVVVVDDLDLSAAIDAGVLAAEAGQPETPVGVMHAVRAAQVRGWPLITGDPKLAEGLGGGVTVLTLE